MNPGVPYGPRLSAPSTWPLSSSLAGPVANRSIRDPVAHRMLSKERLSGIAYTWLT